MKNIGVIYPEKLSCYKYIFYGNIMEITMTDLLIIATYSKETSPNMRLIRLKSIEVNSNLDFLYQFMLPCSKNIKLKNVGPGDEVDEEFLVRGIREYIWEIYDQMKWNLARKKCFYVVGVPKK